MKQARAKMTRSFKTEILNVIHKYLTSLFIILDLLFKLKKMKRLFIIRALFVVVLLLFIEGCKNKNPSLFHAFDNCTERCNEMLKQIVADYNQCTEPYDHDLEIALSHCNPNPPDTLCIDDAFKLYFMSIHHCDQDMDERMKYILDCRDSCAIKVKNANY